MIKKKRPVDAVHVFGLKAFFMKRDTKTRQTSKLSKNKNAGDTSPMLSLGGLAGIIEEKQESSLNSSINLRQMKNTPAFAAQSRNNPTLNIKRGGDK